MALCIVVVAAVDAVIYFVKFVSFLELAVTPFLADFEVVVVLPAFRPGDKIRS